MSGGALARFDPGLLCAFDRILKGAISACGTAALKAFLESCDKPGDVLPTQAGKVRLKMASEKEYLTPFGWVAVSRRLYQADTGGDCLVPLDRKWGINATEYLAKAAETAYGHATHDSQGWYRNIRPSG